MGNGAVEILLVEDNPGDARLLRETLRDAEELASELTHVERLDEAIKRLASERFDVLLLDLSLPDSQGTDTVKRLAAASPHIPVLVLTGTDDAAMGTESVRCGAQDYLVKGQTDHRLLTRAIRYAIERKRVEREREIAVEFLSLVNSQTGVRDLVEASVRFFRRQSSCEAVGIRLRQGDDYPYYETHGFPEQFVRSENSLCVRCQNGKIERDSTGNPVMACMCGNVICGRFDPSKPFFTASGSFWTNSTTRLLASTSEADRQAHTRNRCNGEGYESVALIALRMGEQRLGLLQLNDQRENKFTPETIALWERLAGYLAVALAQGEAAESLRQSEEMHRVFFELGVVGMAYASPDGHLVKVNDKYCELTGYPRAELTGKALLELTHPEDREADRAQMERYFRGEQPFYSAEKRYLRKDGSVRWVASTARLLREADGRPRYSLGIIQDITERKQAKLDQDLTSEVLRVLHGDGGDLQAMIREVLNLVRSATGFDAVGLRLRQGDDCPYYEQDGFTTEFLREENFLCARGGDGLITRDESGQPVLECTCGLVLSGRTDPSMPCFTVGGSFWTNHSPELLALPPEADPRTNPRNRCIHVGYQSVALMPVCCGEQIVGLLQLNDRQPGRFTLERIRFFEGLANNVGLAVQRRLGEEELKAAKLSAEQAKTAAEDASRAKDHFLAVLSHELRNPLTPVLPSLAALQPLVPEEGREYLEIARRNVELEARLIDDLLDVTRIVRGKIELERKPIELCTVVRQAAEVCMPDIEARQLHFGIEIKDNPPHWVDGDAARLQQVFWNLIKNAVKFTPHAGCVGVQAWREGNRAIVAVNDGGVGIEPQALDRIFNAFEQEERSITRQFGGLGLGLAISKALVELHGGSIHAHSGGKGRGATFRVELPIHVPAAMPDMPIAPAHPEPAPSARRLKILLVEDHGDTARVLGRLLTANGHTVQHAGDVATALDLAGRASFDVLLSDLGLPDGSGHDLMRQLVARGQRLPAIALSGYGMAEDVRLSHEAGFAEHVTKPVNLCRLSAALERMTARRQFAVGRERT